MGIDIQPRYKTIDDLGIDSSIRYAENQTELTQTKSLTVAPSLVTKSTELQNATPLFTEYDSIFQTNLRNKGWANFLTPPGFTQQGGTCFSFQMVPSVGSQEQLLMLKQRIQDKTDKEQKNSGVFTSQQDLLEHQLKAKQIVSDAGKISSLLDTLLSLDKILADLNSLKNRYQKG
jgi:hypothetical protein